MANWTATLRGLTLGTSTAYEFEAPGITGLGNPPTRTADQPRGHLSGDVGGDDVLEKRVITIPIAILGDEADGGVDCRTKLRALQTAWRPSSTNIDLVLAIAGESVTYQGRPRGCEADVELLGKGVCRVLLTFEALVPYAQGSSESTPVP